MQPIVIDKNNIIALGHGRVLGTSRAMMSQYGLIIN